MDSGETEDRSTSVLWDEIEDDVRTIFGDSFEFEVEEYGEYTEVHLKPGRAVEELEAEHGDLRNVPFNTLSILSTRSY